MLNRYVNNMPSRYAIAIRLVTLTAALVLPAAAAKAEPRTLNDAVYTEEQAEAGEELYAENCLTCHDKKYFRPVLKAWDGQPLSILYTVMSTSMPESNPGALPRKDYVDILAYILSLNRYPAGDVELDYSEDVLEGIVITDRE
ncbi:MAG TPA: cytochrome c [Woeseiaceae bacterium]|nr:cytochrome c [Woeseiaceae bacterium]